MTPPAPSRPAARPASRRRRLGSAAALLLVASLARAQDPFADAVTEYTVGAGGGFGSEFLPDAVIGPPRGGGPIQQSLDVVSLGNDGTITVRFDLPLICDGPEADFVVFENAFHVGTPEGPVFEEYGIVAVSQDGVEFVEFPYDATSHAGLAGRVPVLSHPDNGIDPLDPSVAGGDTFDLADLGLAWVAYVRITDPGAAIPDPGDRIPPGDKGGFDLDAVAALHACAPGGEDTPTPTFTPTATPPAAGTATATPTHAAANGDLNDDGNIDDADRLLLVAELFDGDGDAASTAAGGDVATGPFADLNGDGLITAADLTALGARAR
jgi:hypothetical protein